MTQMLHASCVAFENRAVLIIGPSGSGKSSLALELLAIGGLLVADDQTILKEQDNTLLARCPDPISGLIEARGIGLLAVKTQKTAVVGLVVDMAHSEPERLPPHRTLTLSGIVVDVIYGKNTPTLAAATKQLIIGGRVA